MTFADYVGYYKLARSEGLVLRYLSDAFRAVRQTVPDCWIELTLTEGRNRQVRRMTAAVGHPTLRLIRAAVGRLALADLAPGAWRELGAAERALVFG